MFTWIKSLFTDAPAGSVLVVAATALVVSLMVALGQIASMQPDANVLLVASDEAADRSVHPAQHETQADAPRVVRSSVSVMVPVNAYR